MLDIAANNTNLIAVAFIMAAMFIFAIMFLIEKLRKPTFKVTRKEQDKLFLAVVAVRTKVLNHESYESCKDKLLENYAYLKNKENVFEGTKYKQNYRDFMHSADIAIYEKKRYLNKDEEDYVLNLMRESSKKLEKVLK